MLGLTTRPHAVEHAAALFAGTERTGDMQDQQTQLQRVIVKQDFTVLQVLPLMSRKTLLLEIMLRQVQIFKSHVLEEHMLLLIIQRLVPHVQRENIVLQKVSLQLNHVQKDIIVKDMMLKLLQANIMKLSLVQLELITNSKVKQLFQTA